MIVRRVVTANRADKTSDFDSDGPAPRSVSFDTVPGFEASMIWAAEPDGSKHAAAEDLTTSVGSWIPSPGGSRLLMVKFPPDAVLASSQADPATVVQEYLAKLPGLAESFEPDDPGMHRTETLDYAVVLEGEIWLELDHGKEVHLKRHDVVVQTGTRHAWRNRGNSPVTMLFVLLGGNSR